MNRRVVCTLALAAAVIFTARYAVPDEEKKGESQDRPAAKPRVTAKCPVGGDAISKEAFVDYKGGKVYFCCAACIPKFKEATAKYATKANVQLVLTGQAKQKACPFSGNKVNPSTKTEVGGVSVAFCCAGCEGRVKKAEGDDRLEMVFGDKTFDKGFVVKTVKQKQKN
jgi:YHS domain-containing protein